MELGEKIRLARTAAGLSQRQLCGEEITRNMLSQIESGKARPSMTTLQYLAARLDKSVSYFLEDSASPSTTALEQARQAYRQGQFQPALEQLENCRDKGEEAQFLQYLCLIAQGKAALGQEKRPYAQQLLEKAGSIETLYKTDATERERLLWLLEACCKELEDYKQAYYYACLQRL